MSEEIKGTDNGGPAFPTDSEGQVGPSTFHYEGMSLRDWFAGRVLAGLYAGDAHPEVTPGGTNHTMRAEYCYEMADAMLAARGSTQ